MSKSSSYVHISLDIMKSNYQFSLLQLEFLLTKSQFGSAL